VNTATRIYSFIVLLAGIAMAVLCLVYFPVSGPMPLFLWLSYAVLLALSFRFPLDIQAGEQILLDTLLTFGGLLMFPPFILLAICALGVLAGGKKPTASWHETMFTLGQKLVAAGLAALILHVFISTPWTPHGVLAWTGMVGAGVALVMAESFLFAGMASLRNRLSFFSFWFNHIEHDSGPQAIQLALGLLIALVTVPYPWALILVIIPLIGTTLAFTRQARLQAGYQASADSHARAASELHSQINHLQETTREMEAARMVNLEMRKAATRAGLPPIVIEQVCHQLLAGSGALVVLDAANGELRIESALGNWARLAGQRSPADSGASGQVVQTGQPYLSTDVRRDPEFTGRERLEGDYCVAGVPLITQNEVIGVLWAGRTAPFETRDLRLLATIADNAATALHRSALLERSEQNTARLAALNQEAAASANTILEAWAQALEMTNWEAPGHTRRVAQLSQRLGRALRLSDAELDQLYRGGLVHDVGKMSIPADILTKPGALDEDEWKIVRRHPQVAYDLLAPIAYLKPALAVPYCHHEKWDGSGYPRGLKGDRIPLIARIFSVVDVWDSLTHERPYRAAWTAKKALEYIRRQAGTHFDPQVVEVFVMIIQEGSPEPLKR
jgi:putative methionine-R-sulfoxide reductase with GAF domain